MLVIPLGFVVDVLTKGYELHPLGVFGVVLTMVGVVKLNMVTSAEHNEKRRCDEVDEQ